jgi:hypothetical protein
MGRHATYSDEIAETILQKLTLGIPLRQICNPAEMPAASTVVKWTETRPEFGERYAHARKLGLDALAEEILEISDDGSNDWMERERPDGSVETVLNSEHINRSRLRVDARKWLLSKMAPKKYGDRIELAGDKENPLEVHVGGIELLKTRIDSLIARGSTDESAPKPD